MDGEERIDLAVLIREPEGKYRSLAGEYETSHLLGDFMKCPLLHQRRVSGLIPDVDRPAYLLGRAIHKRILEGKEAFAEAFAIGGPINPRTNRPFGSATKAFSEWAAAQGKPVLTPEQVELLENMATGVAMSTQAVDLIFEGVAEGVVRATYCGVQCQSRIDWVNPGRGIVDLKSCDDLTWFEADARRYGYLYQMSFYRSMLALAAGLIAPVHIIAVEKKEPYRCGVWRLSDDSLLLAQRENEAALRRLLRCRELNEWPTGYEEIRVLDIS